jgi:hypothetical protein
MDQLQIARLAVKECESALDRVESYWSREYPVYQKAGRLDDWHKFKNQSREKAKAQLAEARQYRDNLKNQ